MINVKKRSIKAFSLIELIFALSILSISAFTSVAIMNSFSRNESLLADSSALASSLRDARARTLASVNGDQFGVKIENNRFIFFRGSVFSVNNSDNEIFIFRSTTLASSSIDTVVFNKLTGDASFSGIIELYDRADNTKKKTITIEGTGLVYLE